MIYDYYAINGSQDKSLTLSDLPNDDAQNPNMKHNRGQETYKKVRIISESEKRKQEMKDQRRVLTVSSTKETQRISQTGPAHRPTRCALNPRISCLNARRVVCLV